MESLPCNPILKFKPDTLDVIRKSFNLDQRELNEAIDRFEEWLNKQEHFVKKDFSRDYIERTIIQGKGSVEKAKSQMDKLCTLKTLLPKFFKNCDIKTEFKDISQIAWLIPLPKMTEDYCRVYIVKINSKEFTSAHFMEYYRFNIVLYEYLKATDYVKGFIVIHDWRDLNCLDLVTKMNVIELQQFMTILMEGYKATIHGIHIITESKVIDLFTSTLKQILSPKMAARVHVYTNIESLYNIVEKDILPVEYGGKEVSVEELNKKWMEIISTEEHTAYMKEMNGACTDESRRSKLDFNNEYIGMPGTFRTLTVD
ncbi:uncharacterized protein LOC115448095 isoform X2 [Manduca sexta]